MLARSGYTRGTKEPECSYVALLRLDVACGVPLDRRLYYRPPPVTRRPWSTAGRFAPNSPTARRSSPVGVSEPPPSGAVGGGRTGRQSRLFPALRLSLERFFDRAGFDMRSNRAMWGTTPTTNQGAGLNLGGPSRHRSNESTPLQPSSESTLDVLTRGRIDGGQ